MPEILANIKKAPKRTKLDQLALPGSKKIKGAKQSADDEDTDMLSDDDLVEEVDE